MRVLAFGTYDRRRHPRVAVLVDGLRASGLQVEECNVPLGFSTASRVQMLREPWRLPRLLIRLLWCWGVLAVLARRAPKPDVVLVGYLGHFDVLLARALFRGVPIVLDHLISASDTANDRGARGSVKQGLLRALDRAAVHSADLVVVDTVEHLGLLPPAQCDKGVVVLVGATDAWHDVGSLLPGPDEPLRVVFFGMFTPLQGAPTIGEALGLLSDEPGVTATLCGSGQDLDATKHLAAPNSRVRFVPWVEPEDLPALVAGHDVCLGIFGTGPKALRVVPNKVYQGMAAGRAVITADTTPQRSVLSDAALFVPAGDAKSLAEALRRLAANRTELAVLQARAAVLAGNAFAPAAVVEPLLARLRPLPPGAMLSHA